MVMQRLLHLVNWHHRSADYCDAFRHASLVYFFNKQARSPPPINTDEYVLLIHRIIIDYICIWIGRHFLLTPHPLQLIHFYTYFWSFDFRNRQKKQNWNLCNKKEMNQECICVYFGRCMGHESPNFKKRLLSDTHYNTIQRGNNVSDSDECFIFSNRSFFNF